LISIIAVYNTIEQLLIAQILKSFFILLSSYSKDQILKNIKFFLSMNNFLSTKKQFSLALRQILFAQVLERRIFFSSNFFSSADN